MHGTLGKRAVTAMAALVLAGGMVLGGEATYETALAAFKAEDYEAAAVQFEELVGKHPDWAPGPEILGQCYYLLGRADEGRIGLERAGELDPETDRYQAYYAVGQTLYRKREYTLSIAPLTQAFDLAGPERRSAIARILGHANLKANRFEAARRVLETEDRLDASSRRHLAIACQQTGDYDCALSNLRSIPESAAARKELARWSHYWALKPSNGDRRSALLAQAVEDTREWLEASPEREEAFLLHADILLAADRFHDLIAVAGPRARSNQDDCAARLVLARAHNGLHDSAEAESWAREEIACSPDSVDGRLELAAALMGRIRSDFSTTEAVKADLRLADGALSAVERALALAPDNKRGAALAADLSAATSRLEEVALALAKDDRDHEIAVTLNTHAEVLERCRNILWKMRDETRTVSKDDRAFYDENDCRQYAAP